MRVFNMILWGFDWENVGALDRLLLVGGSLLWELVSHKGSTVLSEISSSGYNNCSISNITL